MAPAWLPAAVNLAIHRGSCADHVGGELTHSGHTEAPKPRRRSRGCPRATASSLRSRSFSTCSFRLASRSARTTDSCDLVLIRW